MYLTEELFESADADRPYHSPSKQMDSPHHAHQQHSADSLGKRKRNGDEYTTNTVPIKNMKLYSAHHHHHHHHPVDYPPPHHLYPSPPRRKPRAFAQPRPSLHPRAATYPRPTQMDSKTNQPRSSSTTTTSPPTKTSPTTTKADLTPCHSCHRAPKQKTDLDNYDDCAACAGRTCYICMRMCSGPRCGGRKICRACCLEKGEEGETWCFACEQGNVYEGDGDGAGGGDQDVIME